MYDAQRGTALYQIFYTKYSVRFEVFLGNSGKIKYTSPARSKYSAFQLIFYFVTYKLLYYLLYVLDNTPASGGIAMMRQVSMFL